MAQGKRKLMLAIGAGLMVCTGLAGCMNNEKKPLLPTARGPGLSPSTNQNNPQRPGTANTRTPSSGTMGNTGLPASAGFQDSGGFQQGRVQPASGMTPGGMGTPGNTGMIQSPVVPGVVGQGEPLPTNSSVMPSVTPQSSNSSAPDWQRPTSSVAGQTVSARAAAPTMSLRASDPPPPELSDPMPLPPAPPSYGSGMSSSLTPPTPSVASPLPPPDQPPHRQ